MKKSNARNLIGFNINTEKLKKDFGKYDDIVLSANCGSQVYSCLIVTGSEFEKISLRKFKNQYSLLK